MGLLDLMAVWRELRGMSWSVDVCRSDEGRKEFTRRV